MTKPFLRWVGGKQRLMPRLMEALPASVKDPAWDGTWFEPFLGAGAMFLARQPRFAILSDANVDLISVWRELLRDDDFVRYVKHIPEVCNDYYATRAMFNRFEPGTRALQFLWLNRRCFNGLWRVNSRGEFNVPAGRFKTPPKMPLDELRAAKAVMERCDALSIEHWDFEQALEQAVEGDFVYLDPPYVPHKSGAFTGYGGWSDADHERLRDAVVSLDSRGVQFMLSNSNCWRTLDLYDRFHSWPIEVQRSVAASAGARKAADEVIITNC